MNAYGTEATPSMIQTSSYVWRVWSSMFAWTVSRKAAPVHVSLERLKVLAPDGIER